MVSIVNSILLLLLAMDGVLERVLLADVSILQFIAHGVHP